MMMMLRALIICTFLNVLNVAALQNQSQEQKPQINSVIQKQTQEQMPQINSVIQNQTRAQKPQINSRIQNQTQGQRPQINSVIQKQSQARKPQINSGIQYQTQGQKPQINSVIQNQTRGQKPQINSLIQNQTRGQKPQINSVIQNQTQGQKPQINSLIQNQTKPQINSLHEMYKVLAIAKSQAYLNAHNAFRQKMGVPPLQWDTKLEVYAHNFASKCANDCALKHSYGPYGENIFWEQYAESNPAEIVKRFTDEEANYDIQNGECKCHPVSNKCMCGHFTAVIWKSTERVGCAEVSCNGEKGILVVCSYDPPGNTVGQNPLKPLKQ